MTNLVRRIRRRPDVDGRWAAVAERRPPASVVFGGALAILVITTVVILPLVFVPGLGDDYALPKAMTLRVMALVGAGLFVGYVLSGGPLTRNADRRLDLPSRRSSRSSRWRPPHPSIPAKSCASLTSSRGL